MSVVSQVVVAISSKETLEIVERWQFNLDVLSGGIATQNLETKKEIQAIIRQITASVTFLPELEPHMYTVNVLVYADAQAQIPKEWHDNFGDGKLVLGDYVETVKLKSFSTVGYKVGASVCYKFGSKGE